MEKRYLGKISDDTKKRLTERLNNSHYWAEKFEAFDLKLDHVIFENFPNYISTGGIQKTFQEKVKDLIFQQKNC